MAYTDQIILEDRPLIPGLCFRHFRGPSDYPSMAAVLTASEKADQIQRLVTADNLAEAFQHLTHCDPYRDLILAEIDGTLVGYARGWWREESATGRLYSVSGFILPEWRRKGIGRAMQCWMENRLKEVAVEHPPATVKQFQLDASQDQPGKVKLFEALGYQKIRYFYHMVRPTLDEIPDWPLPSGVEVRQATEDHYREIWRSVEEASQDEWGHAPTTEEDYQEWLTSPHFQPHLWQIAWCTETQRVVGHVLTYIHQEENLQFQRKRGYTEGIGVDRAWRRRGLARALISRSLVAQKAAGMTESALVSDSESPSGATHLYESCGFQVVSCNMIFRKTL